MTRPRPRCHRYLERRSIHALRRGGRRGAPGLAAAPGRRHRHRAHGGRLRGGRSRPAAGARAGGSRARLLLRRGSGGPRLLRGRAPGREGLPALHADTERLRRLPADGDGALARAVRARLLRPAAAPQPRPRGLHERGGVGGHARPPRSRARQADRRRARARERFHARPDRLLRALRRCDRLGDDHPQPARAVARRDVPAGGARGGRPADHARRRLRRAVPRRRPAGAPVPRARPPRLPARRAGWRRGARSSSGCATSAPRMG